MSRVRTIPKAIAEIKAADPGTYLTAPTLRRWLKAGYIKPIVAGGHILIDLDALEDFIRKGAGAS